MTTGDEIRSARERAGLTQGELGTRVGVSLRTVGNWERGATVPQNRLAKIRAVLSGHWQDDEPTHEAGLSTASDVELLAEIARRFARTGKEGTHDREDAPEPGPQEGSPQHRSQDSAEDGSETGRGTPMNEAGEEPAANDPVDLDQERRQRDDWSFGHPPRGDLGPKPLPEDYAAKPGVSDLEKMDAQYDDLGEEEQRAPEDDE